MLDARDTIVNNGRDSVLMELPVKKYIQRK